MSIEMPTYPNFTTSRFSILTNTQTWSSPLTNDTQRVLLGGARWQATYSLRAMNKAQVSPWDAFFMLLEGRANTFNGFDPDRKTPRGPATGTPLVNGGSQTGSSLLIDGCTPNIEGWLLPADFFSVNGELKKVTSPINTDGSGNATINFKPILRSSPLDDTPITTSRASCLMVLSDDQQAIWDCDKYGIYQPRTFTAIEVFS